MSQRYSPEVHAFIRENVAGHTTAELAAMTNAAFGTNFDANKMKCYDPHNASAFLQDLEATGYDSLEIHQSAKALSDPTEDFRLEIAAGNVEYNRGEELLVWSILNARTISNNYGEVKIDKDITTQRIDPVDAVIDAWKVAMCGEQAQTTEEIVAEWLKMYERHTKVETKK